MTQILEFEKPIVELENKIEELRSLSSTGDINIAEEIQRLEKKLAKLLASIYSKLTPWQKVLVARHVDRPHCLNYIDALFEDFMPLAGDRNFGEDRAIVGGIGRFRGTSVMVVGQEKGHDMETRLKHNFGMPKPEGYRKACRLMQLAEKYAMPVITFIDTSGAYAGLEAEERGQAEAIARSINTSLNLTVPIISVVIGEGGSGGAIALATANEVYMLEHSIYSVISPEGCAAILWRSSDKKEIAAQAQKLTAQDLYKLGVIEGVILEPLGGAHRQSEFVFDGVGKTIEKSLRKFGKMVPEKIKEQREERFLNIGSRQL